MARTIDEIRTEVHARIRATGAPEAEEAIAADREDTEGYPDADLLWHYLELAMLHAPEAAGAPAVPWGGGDVLVTSIWGEITDPAREPDLKDRYNERNEYDRFARRLVEVAWRQMGERKRSAAP